MYKHLTTTTDKRFLLSSLFPKVLVDFYKVGRDIFLFAVNPSFSCKLLI